MNNERFTELLNLYLDNEIERDDAKALEQEIRDNPERRALYQQYCRLQKGTAVLFEASRQSATSPVLRRSYADIMAKVQAGRPEPTVSWWTWGTAGTLAAAACVALVFVAQPDRPSANPTMVQQPSLHEPVAGAALARVTTPAPTPVNLNTHWSETALSYHAVPAAIPGLDQSINFRPIAKVQSQAVPFTVSPADKNQKSPELPWVTPLEKADENVEMSAVQFKR